MTTADLSGLPRVDVLVDAADELVRRYGRKATAAAVRTALDRARHDVRGGAPLPDADALLGAAAAALTDRFPGPPRRVINAAGVVIHTNLGRAPLSSRARAAMDEAAGYCDLEYDLHSGRRGSRDGRLGGLLADACDAEAGIAVNNAAGALVLVLAALASGRQVPVARGELVEIGGSFRLPEIMAASGAELLEVGTTNRTRASDYRAGDDVGLLLKVHPSNYRVTGFAEAAGVTELAAIARDRRVPLVHDVGSGLLADRNEPFLRDEPSVRASLAAGADLVVCSGDKLLGGPQAGLLVGRADLVEACRRHPLARALRLDKLRIAALTATLEAHLCQELSELPVWRALLAEDTELTTRARALAQRLGGEVVEGTSLVGGGSAPQLEIPSPVVTIDCRVPDAVAAALRAGDPPVIVRIGQDALQLDLRTVDASDDELVAELVDQALRRCT